MCGIAAIFSRRDPIPAAVISQATRSLYHRGPDGQKHWIAQGNRVALCHARLSIIDQPIASEDERTRIVVNGEFYGYESIQRELENAGHRLRTRSDSEIAHICMRILASNACIDCVASSHLYSGMTPTGPSSPPVTGSALSRCSMHSTRTRCIWPRK